MKKLFSILLLICALTLCLAACGGNNDSNDNGEGESLSPEAIADIRSTLDTMSFNLDAMKNTLDIYLSTYELQEITNDVGAVVSYNNACDEYESTLEYMKETIDYCRENSDCFSEETHASIDALEEIYNDSLSSSKSTSKNNKKAYAQVMEDLADSITAWTYVRTAE